MCSISVTCIRRNKFPNNKSSRYWDGPKDECVDSHMENGGYWLSVVLSGNWYSTLPTNLLLVKICYRLRFFYVQREWYSSHTRHIYVPSQNRYLLRPIRSADNLLVELHPMAVRCVLFLYQGCLTRNYWLIAGCLRTSCKYFMHIQDRWNDFKAQQKCDRYETTGTLPFLTATWKILRAG